MKFWELCSIALVTALACSTAAQPSLEEHLLSDEVRALSHQLAQERVANRRSMQLFAPLVRGEAKAITEIFLLNLTTLPIDVDLWRYDGNGEKLFLTSISVQPQTHQVVDLSDSVQTSAGIVGQVGVAFEGDNDSLQCWTVHRNGLDAFETTCTNPAKFDDTKVRAFWSSGGSGRSQSHLSLFNVSASRIPYRAVFEEGKRRRFVQVGVVEPLRLLALPVPSSMKQSGSLDLTFEGSPGDLLASGIVLGANSASAVPIVESSQLGGDSDYHGFPLSQLADLPVVTVFNPYSEGATFEVRAIDTTEGVVLRQQSFRIGAKEVRDYSTTELFKGLALAKTRLEITSRANLLVQARARGSRGESIELTLFPAAKAHGGGTYPLPPLSTNEVVFSAVNLSSEEITILGQVFWSGGAYTLEPFIVPPKAAREINFEALATAALPDLLGRTLDPQYEHGYFKWLARGLQDGLIGRTEARPKAGEDRFGFNCFGCCWEYPSGSVLPNTVAFLPGQSTGFQSCVTYATCGGTMGPFPTPVNYVVSPAPFSWDGTTVGASAAGSEDLQFQSTEEEIGAQCVHRDRNINGLGKASTCKEHLSRPGKPPWSATMACTLQVGGEFDKCTSCTDCCGQYKSYLQCEKKNQAFITTEYNACIGACISDHC